MRSNLLAARELLPDPVRDSQSRSQVRDRCLRSLPRRRLFSHSAVSCRLLASTRRRYRRLPVRASHSAAVVARPLREFPEWVRSPLLNPDSCRPLSAKKGKVFNVAALGVSDSRTPLINTNDASPSLRPSEGYPVSSSLGSHSQLPSSSDSDSAAPALAPGSSPKGQV